MKRYNITVILLFVVVVLFVSTTIADLRNRNQVSQPQKSKQAFDDDEVVPLTDFTAPEEADENKRAKRHAKNKKYDKSQVIGPNTTSGVAVRGGAVDVSLPAFPIIQSSAIVIGEITDAQAYLSNDKTGIYSEFSICIEKVVKNAGEEPITNDSVIEAEREGGRVRFPAGHIFRYEVERQRMPRVRARYLLFLTRKNQEAEFHILTGYELRGGKVYPLDNLPQPKIYEGADETTFLDELQTILSSSSQKSSL